jgi:hypothetical protein
VEIVSGAVVDGLDLAAVRCPQLFMPASNDGESVKVGGLTDTVVGDKLQEWLWPDGL